MQDREHFAQRYTQLSDDELAELALHGELLSEAQEVLAAELEKRGIKDLSIFRKRIEADAAIVEEDRQGRLERSLRVVRWRSIAFCILAGLIFVFALLQLLLPQWKHGRDDVALCIGLGVAILALTWIDSKLSRFWYEKVIFRKSPRQLALDRVSNGGPPDDDVPTTD